MATVPDGKAWVVTGQTRTVAADASNNVGPGWNVSYLTAGGTAGTVFVPDTQYTPSGVAALVGDLAGRNDSINGMSG
jgi:hypothetical protein